MPTHSLPHVFRRNGLFYVRILVPQALRALVGKSELRYSLRTGYRAEACLRSGDIAAHIKRLFDMLRKGDAGLPELTKNNIPELVEKYIRSRLDDFLDVRADDARLRALHDEAGMGEGKSDKDYPLHKFLVMSDFRVQHNRLSSYLENFLADSDFNTARHSLEFHHFLNATTPVEKLLIKYFSAVINEDDAEAKTAKARLEDVKAWNHSLPRPAATPDHHYPATPAAPSPLPTTGHALSDALNHFKREREKTWAVRTQAEYAAILDTFHEIVGDIDCERVTKDTLRAYKNALLKLPRARGRKSQFRDLPISQILLMNYDDNKVSHETVNKHMGLVSSFLLWAADNGYCAGNVATRMKIRLKKADPKDARAPWSHEELEVLFSAERYPMDGPAHMFWLPVLGLLTGARLDELCQLRCCDIKNINEIWCIDINAEDGKRVKNQPSIRIFPIHPIVAQQLRFIDFVKRMETHAKAPLFPELLGFKSHSGKIASAHFSHFKDRVLKITNDKISFHSLRHTAKKWVGTLNVQKLWVNDLFGWTQEGVGDRNYGDKSQIVTLNEHLVLPLWSCPR